MIPAEAVEARVTQLRPRASETFVCPCGSQWFSMHYRMDTNGRIIERSGVATCDGGCGRKGRPVTPSEAVEAAAKYIWLNSIKGRRTCEAWETLDESDKRPCREDAFAILETAAPHLFPQQCHSIDDGEQCLLKHDHGVAPTYRQHINGHVYPAKD